MTKNIFFNNNNEQGA